MRFADLLSRADTDVVQHLLGTSAVRLLAALDPNLCTPDRLRLILVALQPPAVMLRDARSRETLFDLLRPAELKTLMQVAGVNDQARDPYAALKAQPFRKGSDRERALFEFFELSQEMPNTGSGADESVTNKVGPSYPLFDHQRAALRRVKNHLAVVGRTLLHMPTGSGKTRTAANAVCDHLRANEGSLVIWLAYSEELCDQAVDEIREAWKHLGDREIALARFYRSHDLEKLPQDGVLVAGLGKMHSRTMKELNFIHRLGSAASLVVMDEAHQAVAETYQLVLDALVLPYPNVKLLGLSATPGRTYNDVEADRRLSAFFKRSKVTLEVPGYASPIDYLIDEGYIAKPVFRDIAYKSLTTISGHDLERLSQGLDVPLDILQRLAHDEQRNLSIIYEVEKLCREHTRTLVFTASVEHSDLLAAILQARGIHAASVTGKTSREQRARLITVFKGQSAEHRVLCNFGVLTTGFDAPRTSAVVIARPTKSLVLYSQMLGRGIRGVRAGGNATAVIATVVDQDLPGFRDVSEAFRNWEDVWGE